MKWKQKNGILIDTKDMTTEHISNTIKLIEKNSSITEKYYTDSGYSGDSYVPDFVKIQRKMTKYELRKKSPIYLELLQEFKKRNTQ